MRKLILAAAIAALTPALGGVGYGADGHQGEAPAMSTAPAPKALSATGKIVSFDDARRR